MHNIAIRADGGAGIGLGHIMRCLSLATELRKNGQRVYFISKYKEGIETIEKFGFEVARLGVVECINQAGCYFGSIEALTDEATEIESMIKADNTDILIVDTYKVSLEYLIKLKQSVKLVYIDDINKFIYPVDILVNGNVNAEDMDYSKYAEDEILLLGTKYNLVREEFQFIGKRQINNEVKEIMITVGGSDPYGMSWRFAEVFLHDTAFKNMIINIIIGIGFVYKEQLRDMCKEYSNIVLHENVTNLSFLMKRVDLAISAGGSTLYELCASGTPTLAFLYAENQRGIVSKFEELGCIKSIGWYEDINYHKLKDVVLSLCGDYSRRVEYSKRMRSIIDGCGVQRTADIIINSLIATDLG